MSEKHRQFFWLVPVLFAVLISSVAVAIILNIVFPSTSSNGLEASFFTFFFLGIIFSPRILKRYRRIKRSENKVAWYKHIELLLCLVGLSAGPCFILSIARRWIEFVLNSKGTSLTTSFNLINNLHWMMGLTIAQIFFFALWLIFIVLVLFQGIKQRAITTPL